MPNPTSDSQDPQLLLRTLHDEKLGIERMADTIRLLQRLLAPMALSRAARIAMHSISSDCAHLLRTYHDLSESAAQQVLCTVELDLSSLIRRTTAHHAAYALARGIRLGFQCKPGALIAKVDPVLIERLLDNLLSNAINHTRRGGMVQVKLVLKGSAIQLSVRDNGSGIDRSLLPHIFDPYVTSRAGGSGLGLPNVKHIAELHHGSVRCASKLGIGTLMIVQLPL